AELVEPVVGAGGAVVGGAAAGGEVGAGEADADAAWAAWLSRLPAWLMSVWYLPRSPAFKSFWACAYAACACASSWATVADTPGPGDGVTVVGAVAAPAAEVDGSPGTGDPKRSVRAWPRLSSIAAWLP